MNSLTVWTNHGLNPSQERSLLDALGPHRLLSGAHATADELARADVAFGQPPPQGAAQSASLAWVHLSSAGYTSYARLETRRALEARNAQLTTSSTVYSSPCAEHVLAFMLAWARQLPQAFATQGSDRGWPQGELRRHSRLLQGQRVILFGFGSIGVRLAELLAPFTPHITGVRRKARGDEPIETLSFEDPRVEERLASAEHVVNLLPAADFTARYFDRARLGRLQQGAIFYNVGRGSTVDQQALAERLTQGALGAALLDVTEPEPLPPSDPLWTTPNCFITPHTAGGHHDEGDRLVQHFIANLRRFLRSEPLLDRVY